MKTAFGWKHGLMTAIIGLVGSAFGIGAPGGLTVAQIDYTQAACNLDCSAKLSWTTPAEGTPTGYKIYRRMAAHEQPTLAGTVGADTTTFTDSTATVGQTYLYTVTTTDADGESAESEAVSFRKVVNMATTANGTWSLSGTMTTSWGNYKIAHLNDGNVSTGTRIEGAGSFTYLFSDTLKPVVTVVRLYRTTDVNVGSDETLSGLLSSASDLVEIRNHSASPSAQTWASGQWSVCNVDSYFSGSTWTGFRYGNGNWYPGLGEFEAYGFIPSTLLGSPSVAEPIVGDSEAVLSWTGAANAASYTVYRKVGEGAWTSVANGLTACVYKDTGLADGTVYTYRVAAVASNGDESSAAEGVTITAQATATEIPSAYGLAAAAIDFTQAACNIDCSAQLSWSLVSAANYDKVRVYRFLQGHEDETPAPIATLDKATTTYADTTAVVGQAYVYKVACYDSTTDSAGPLSAALAYVRSQNIAKHDVNGTWTKTGDPLTTWGNWQTFANLSDGVAGTGSGIRIEGNGTLVFTFTSTARRSGLLKSTEARATSQPA